METATFVENSDSSMSLRRGHEPSSTVSGRTVWRADATTAVAASAAEETYRLIDELPEWQNDTGALWRLHLQRVWEFLQGDHSQHYALSRAVADFLTSPLNHNKARRG